MNLKKYRKGLDPKKSYYQIAKDEEEAHPIIQETQGAEGAELEIILKQDHHLDQHDNADSTLSQEDIEALKTMLGISDIKKDLDDIKKDLDDIKKDLKDVTKETKRIQVIKDDVTTLKMRVPNLERSIKALKPRVEKVEKALKTKADKS